MTQPQRASSMIRISIVQDLPALVAIYNQGVESGISTADLAPVSIESKQGWFAEHDPSRHPIYVWAEGGAVLGWCSLSPDRPGRMALRFTCEISYFVRADSRRKGIAKELIGYALEQCKVLTIKNVFAIVLERNLPSCALLEKLGFERWGLLPAVADFNGDECGHIYFGKRAVWSAQNYTQR